MIDKEITETGKSNGPHVLKFPAVQQYQYQTVPDDPLKVNIYTLKNGLKIYLSVNKTEPRVFTNIAVRAGSKHDPADATGLAHYLEHMMFKGTSQIGALDWEKEKVLLEKISGLYEQHRQEKDPAKRKAIYKKIDETSFEAAQLVAASEYDKMVSVMGARGTNAYTWVEQTVYVNDIPSNELARWMELESERFKMVALRLFHTELETVYEEFNITQDKDFRKVSKAVNETLYPTHPYGMWTTIGKAEHLKSPSHVKIQEYFSNYYQPNNMAIVLAGDFDPDEAVALAERYFGSYRPGEMPAFTYDNQRDLDQIVKKEVFGQEAPYVQMAWRFSGANSADADYLTMISHLLFNGKAGLIDLGLLQKQLVLDARSFVSYMEDYSTFTLLGKPRDGQALEAVERHLLEQLERIKSGQFEDWLPEAVVKDLKLADLRSNESNASRTNQMTNAFILDYDWTRHTKRFERLSSITKEDIVRFANERFRNNYVVVYKRHGDDPEVVKVEKPAITPLSVNRSATSGYAKKFLSVGPPAIEPVFVDFKKEIHSGQLASGVQFDYISNHENATFYLYYILEMGRNSDKELALAISYLPYLGTGRFSPEQLHQEFFRLGLNFSVSVNDERAYVSLSGLDESLEEGIVLFEHILANVESSGPALDNLVNDILVRRENNKKNKDVILREAMYNYARYGKDSPFTNKLSPEELKSLDPGRLVNKIKGITSFEHRVFYYGSKGREEVKALLEKHHLGPENLLPVLPQKVFAEQPTRSNKVLFVDFPMVQVEFMLVSKGSPKFSMEEYIMAELYNTYFGSGLSSVIFQEIRESRALAYAVSAAYLSPVKADEAHYLRAYTGTQPDKLEEALAAMTGMIENMPVSLTQIEQARASVLKKIASGRITKDNIYWSFHLAKRRGYEHDLRRDIYERMQTVTAEELVRFHENFVKGRKFTFLVLGSKAGFDMRKLENIGEVTELSLDEVFGY